MGTEHFRTFCMALLLLAFPITVTAAEVAVEPSLFVRGEYDDNVAYTRRYKKSDYLAKIKPAFRLNYRTEVLDLESNLAAEIYRYRDETCLNTEDQHYDVNGTLQLTERLSVSGNGAYRKDTTLESELFETGLTGNTRQDRKRYTGGMSATYKLTEKWDAGLNYNYTKTEYDWEGNVDYNVDSISASFNYLLNNQLDMITIQPYYAWMDSQATSTDNYGLSFGLMHAFSETLSLTAYAGVRYTKTSYSYVNPRYMVIINPITGEPEYFVMYTPVDEKDSNFSGVADVGISKTGETFSATIGYDQDLSYSSYGEPIEVYKAYFNTDRRITERLRIRFSGSFYVTKSEGKYNDRDERYFNVSPVLAYRLTRDYSVEVGYLHSESRNKQLSSNKTTDRNRVWVGLRFRYPMKWQR